LGGFGEKGRTCIGVSTPSARFLLDCGIHTGAQGRERYPAIGPADLARLDAILITHAHEDHVGALGWAIANGFSGRVLMTGLTHAEAVSCWDDYAEPAHRGLAARARIELFDCGETLIIGDVRLCTGRSGHVAGGVWCAVEHAGQTLVHCGDVVPASAVFAMDPLPACDALLLDASYGDDEADGCGPAAVAAWVARVGGACVLPTPLIGRSLELMAALEGCRVALHPEMRESLLKQIATGPAWLTSMSLAQRIAAAIAASTPWREGEDLPPLPLLVHDGMGLSGPAEAAMAQARQTGAPILLTGHLPKGSPAQRLRAEGHADWIRLATHPACAENVALWRASKARIVLGHSCEADALARLRVAIPALKLARTGDSFTLGENRA
jgi:L-ascorbate metabolism protein UlaG (beta-lactamase superfamily)